MSLSKNPSKILQDAQIKIKKLPIGIKGVVFSFIDLVMLIDKMSKLSKEHRNYLTISEVLDQPRVLLINFGNKYKITYDQLAYSLKLCTGVKFNIMSFMGENDEFMM